jgi:CDP-diacylglycerol--glycerol-3-phosphate 3-phosphatidyltransferase
MAKILSGVRPAVGKVVDPVARALLRVGVTPDAITVAGTVGILVASVLAANDHILIAVILATISALTDILDGAMARARGTSSRFGAFLDSSLDRVADGAIFASLAWWAAKDEVWHAVFAALVIVVASQVTSYVRAKAESLGLSASVGIVERPERLLGIGVGGFAAGFGWDGGMYIVLWILAVLSVVTVAQRFVAVYRQTREPGTPFPAAPSAGEPSAGPPVGERPVDG